MLCTVKTCGLPSATTGSSIPLCLLQSCPALDLHLLWFQTSLDGKKIKPAEVSTSSRPEARSAEAKLDEKQTLTTSKSSVTSKKSNKSKDSGSTKTTPTRTTPATTPPKKEQEKDMDESDGGKENEEAALDLGEPPELQDDLEVHILNVMQR